MTMSSQTADVTAAVRRVTNVKGYKPAPYDIVCDVLQHRMGYDREAAAEAIDTAIMDGALELSWYREATRDGLCIDIREGVNA